MCHLQELYEQYKDQGLVILGFNSADQKEIALEFLAENGATFPTIIDASDAAMKIGFQDYRASGVPVNYIIDRQGKIVDGWYGYEQGHGRAKMALAKAGIGESLPVAEGIVEVLAAALRRPSPKTPASAPTATSKAPASAPAKADEPSQRGETWSISIRLDAPSLVPPAVQLAILDQDPVVEFSAAVKRMQAYHQQRFDDAVTEDQKKLARYSAMVVHWDGCFKAVTGDEVHLLTTPGGSTLVSNSPGGKRWIATKTRSAGGKAICWCIPVELKPGERIDITLSEGNQFDLDAALNDAMRKGDRKK